MNQTNNELPLNLLGARVVVNSGSQVVSAAKTVRRSSTIVAVALAAAVLVPAASAQTPLVFKKDSGMNQQIEYSAMGAAWSQVPGALITNVAPAAITWKNTVYLFGVKPDNSIAVKTLVSDGICGNVWTSWQPFPVGGQTDVSVAPVIFAGSLFLIRKDMATRQLYITSTSTGTNWAPWQLMDSSTDPLHAIPADSGPTAASMVWPATGDQFLLVAIKDIGSNIRVKKYTYSTNTWTAFAVLGGSDLGPSMTTVPTFTYGPPPSNCAPGSLCLGPLLESDTVYLTARDDSKNYIWVEKTVDGNTWSGWNQVLPVGTEPVPVANAAPSVFGGDGNLLLFANVFGNFAGVKQSLDGAAWSAWTALPGPPSDVAVSAAKGLPCFQ
jgi:hypothetical protein